MKQSFPLIIFLLISACAFSQPNISADGPLEFCSGESVTLCADSGYASYLWCTGSTTQCITVTESGDYCVTVMDSLGNIDSTLVQNPVTVTVHATGPLLIDSNDDTLIIVTSEEFASYQWYFAADTLVGETESFLVIPEENDPSCYWVEATDSIGCVRRSMLGGFDFPCETGVQDQNNVIWNLFPNPASELVKIDFANSGTTGSMVITDFIGRLVEKQNLKKTQSITLTCVDDWPNGIYFISLQSEKGIIHTEKLIVQHE